MSNAYKILHVKCRHRGLSAKIRMSVRSCRGSNW